MTLLEFHLKGIGQQTDRIVSPFNVTANPVEILGNTTEHGESISLSDRNILIANKNGTTEYTEICTEFSEKQV